MKNVNIFLTGILLITILYFSILAALSNDTIVFRDAKKKIYDKHYIYYLEDIISLQDSIIKVNEYKPNLILKIK